MWADRPHRHSRADIGLISVKSNFRVQVWTRSSLAPRQRGRLLALLQSAAGLDRLLEVIEQPVNTPCYSCCQADRPYRYGHAHGLQRYRCRHCVRTLNALSGTPLARLCYKFLWTDYLDCMLDSRSGRHSALDTSQLSLGGTAFSA